MADVQTQPRGLTRIIYEALVSQTPELAASGESWTPEILRMIEDNLRQSMSPRDSRRSQLVFNMVFHRAFSEASDLLLTDCAMRARNEMGSGSAYPQAVHATV